MSSETIEVTVNEETFLETLQELTPEERTSLIVKHSYELMKLLVANETGMDMVVVENSEGKEGPRVCFLFGLSMEDDLITELWQKVMEGKGNEDGEKED